MNQSEGNDRSVVIEKTFPHSPEKLWQAMTDPKLLAEWLLPNNFGPQVGQEFQFRNEPVGGWDGVVDCKILVSMLRTVSPTPGAHLVSRALCSSR